MRRSDRSSQRPSGSSASEARSPAEKVGLVTEWLSIGLRALAITWSRAVPRFTSSSVRPKVSRYLELQSTTRSLASHRTKVSEMFSMALLSCWFASSVRRASSCWSLTSTAMPMRWISFSPLRQTSARARSQTYWPSRRRMRNMRSRLEMRPAATCRATSNRLPSSGWSRGAISPKERTLSRGVRPSISYIERDQYMRPRPMSQSQRPQWPRDSAVSTR